MVGIDDGLITRYAGGKRQVRQNNSIQMKNKGEENTFKNPPPMQSCALGPFLGDPTLFRSLFLWRTLKYSILYHEESTAHGPRRPRPIIGLSMTARVLAPIGIHEPS